MLLVLVALSVSLLAVDEVPTYWHGTVVKIVDGDTYWIEWSEPVGDPITSVRPYLIASAEINERPPECYGAEAAQYCWNLLLGRHVWIVHYNRYSGDRLLGFVYLDSESSLLLQTLLIAQGFARVDIRHPEEESLRAPIEAVEAVAQKFGFGLWESCR